MVHRAIEPEDLREMLRGNRALGRKPMTHAEIAAQTGLTPSGVAQAVMKYGLARPRISHKWAIPWRVAKGPHYNGKIVKYLRDLSSIAQGKEIAQTNKVTAVRWAERLVNSGLDIDYDPEKPPNAESKAGGFYTKPAPKKLEQPEDWHLKYVLDRAKAGITQKL